MGGYSIIVVISSKTVAEMSPTDKPYRHGIRNKSLLYRCAD